MTSKLITIDELTEEKLSGADLRDDEEVIPPSFRDAMDSIEKLRTHFFCQKVLDLYQTVGDVRQKLRSYGLSFHEFRPLFALFPIVGTGRIDVTRGLVNASVVSHIMELNSSHVKGGRVDRRRQCIRTLERCREICPATRRRDGVTARNSTDHSPQVRTSSDSRFAKPQTVGTRLKA
ncbi:hypothetical protein AVEN_132809-1 [Araneus ventricosus]|uniref:Uncharacterized protein n=1 Tax=Araneus ventricosus TaxID=182803 RepID=A0A4Y2TJV5_ARAVE|nr:hypothetical protein AVEN_132809-1 [Araneus ventricosus]